VGGEGEVEAGDFEELIFFVPSAFGGRGLSSLSLSERVRESECKGKEEERCFSVKRETVEVESDGVPLFSFC
jgi:hypothetical protein